MSTRKVPEGFWVSPEGKILSVGPGYIHDNPDMCAKMTNIRCLSVALSKGWVTVRRFSDTDSDLWAIRCKSLRHSHRNLELWADYMLDKWPSESDTAVKVFGDEAWEKEDTTVSQMAQGFFAEMEDASSRRLLQVCEELEETVKTVLLQTPASKLSITPGDPPRFNITAGGVASISGKVWGSSFESGNPEATGERNIGEIVFVEVSDHAQRKGIGTLLVMDVLRLFKDNAVGKFTVALATSKGKKLFKSLEKKKFIRRLDSYYGEVLYKIPD